MEVKKLPKRSEVKKDVESPIERILYRWFLEYHVHVELQYEIPPYRVDFALPDLKVVVECDGKEFHSSEEQIEYDRKRDSFLMSKGWKVLRYTGSRIFLEPTEVVKEVIALYYPTQPISEMQLMTEKQTDEWVKHDLEVLKARKMFFN